MTDIENHALRPGYSLPVVELPPLERHTLVLFAEASGDSNPVHIDVDFARRSGFEDVFAHGMLSMAWLGRVVTRWLPTASLRSLDARFVAVVHLDDRLTCSGEVLAVERDADELRLRVGLWCVDQHQQVKTTGEAVLALPA